MREFRALDTVHGWGYSQPFSFESLFESNGDVIWIDDDGETINYVPVKYLIPYGIIIEQFTGLHDKNEAN